MGLHLEEGGGDNEMAQWVKVLASKPVDLSSIPKTHAVEGENQLTKVVLQSPYTFPGTCAPTYTHANR